MKLKVINPNTTASMTAKIGRAARAAAGVGTTIVAVSPRSGPRCIETAYDEALAAVGVLEEITSGEAEGTDGYVIACFGDPGLLAARALTRAPVVGIAEAAMHLASCIGEGFSIISMPSAALPGMERLVQAYGMERRCRAIRMLDMGVLDLEDVASEARTRILDECRRVKSEDQSACVLLGCAGMAELRTEIMQEVGLLAVDGVMAGVKLAEALVGLGLGVRQSR